MEKIDDNQPDPYFLSFAFMDGRVRCAGLEETRGVKPVWRNYTPKQAAYLLETVIASRDWHNQVIADLTRLAGEEIEAVPPDSGV